MATYIIGDVQGCFTELQALLNLINFDPAIDQLGFVGDLVNRGPDSLNTLRFIKSLNNPIVVLGNHDLHLLALASRKIEYTGSHTLDAILNADDCEILIDWLRQKPLLYYHAEQNFVLVHAGLPPQWSLSQALNYASEVEAKLSSETETYIQFLQEIYGNQPDSWDPALSSHLRWRYIINGFTRLRFCNDSGKLDLYNKTPRASRKDMQPWFNWYSQDQLVLFGHWAALKGISANPKCIALDTGCAWGGGLTAFRIEDQRRFYMPAILSKTNVWKE